MQHRKVFNVLYHRGLCKCGHQRCSGTQKELSSATALTPKVRLEYGDNQFPFTIFFYLFYNEVLTTNGESDVCVNTKLTKRQIQ